jgi:hypothetical protein
MIQAKGNFDVEVTNEHESCRAVAKSRAVIDLDDDQGRDIGHVDIFNGFAQIRDAQNPGLGSVVLTLAEVQTGR